MARRAVIKNSNLGIQYSMRHSNLRLRLLLYRQVHRRKTQPLLSFFRCSPSPGVAAAALLLHRRDRLKAAVLAACRCTPPPLFKDAASFFSEPSGTSSSPADQEGAAMHFHAPTTQPRVQTERLLLAPAVARHRSRRQHSRRKYANALSAGGGIAPLFGVALRRGAKQHVVVATTLQWACMVPPLHAPRREATEWTASSMRTPRRHQAGGMMRTRWPAQPADFFRQPPLDQLARVVVA